MGKWDIPANINFAQYENPLQRIIGEAVEMKMKQEEDAAMAHITEVIGYKIDKTELIRALNYDRDQYAKGYEAGLNADKWISVKDQLPEREGEYLVTRNGRIEIDSYYKNRKREGCRFNGERWEDYEEIGDMWISGGGIIWENPEAWMELPEIYHEKEGDEE